MENFIDYIIYVLMGSETIECKKVPSGCLFTFNGAVTFVFDLADRAAVLSVYAERVDRLDEEERTRYERFFSYFV